MLANFEEFCYTFLRKELKLGATASANVNANADEDEIANADDNKEAEEKCR